MLITALIIWLLCNTSAAYLHWRNRKVKFSAEDRELDQLTNGLSITVAFALTLCVSGCLPMQSLYLKLVTAFHVACFWIFITLINIHCNNKLGEDIFNKKWHRWQYIQWVSFHVIVGIVTSFWFSLALWGLAIFFFDGFANIKSKYKRTWFYVGLHSGAVDSWLSSMAHPQRNKAVMYVAGTLLCVFAHPVWKGLVFVVNWICDLLLSIF